MSDKTKDDVTRTWIFLCFFWSMFLVGTFGALSALAAPSPTQGQAPSSINSNDVLYSAQFWVDAPNSKEKLQFVIARAPETTASQEAHTIPATAQIQAGKTILATCTLSAVEKAGKFTPPALRMECRNEAVPLMMTQATLILPASSEQQPILQFGTWARGYQIAVLKVDTDQLSAQDFMRGTVRQLASSK